MKNKSLNCNVKVKVLATQMCPTLCDPMDCSPPGSSVHGFFSLESPLLSVKAKKFLSHEEIFILFFFFFSLTIFPLIQLFPLSFYCECKKKPGHTFNLLLEILSHTNPFSSFTSSAFHIIMGHHSANISFM